MRVGVLSGDLARADAMLLERAVHDAQHLWIGTLQIMQRASMFQVQVSDVSVELLKDGAPSQAN
jgi:hypothetical protein